MSDPAVIPLAHAADRVPTRYPLRAVLVTEGMLSFAANLLFVGIFFYTTSVFGWGIVPNFLLATGQGLVYVVAALATQKLSRALGRRTLLVGSNLALTAVSLGAALTSSQPVIVALVLAYVPLIALNWPVLETLASEGAEPRELSRRIGVYNLVWAGTGALAIAVQGSLLRLDPRAVFLAPAILHLATALIFAFTKSRAAANGSGGASPSRDAHAAPHAEPELLAQRTLALWLSRISQPAAYVVLYTISALMPLLPPMRGLNPAYATLLASVWLVSRWLAFLLLGATTFWHVRPGLLLWAAALMTLAFLGISVSPSYLRPAWAGADLPMLIGAQVVLGFTLGLIYTASLYFGMVLSDSSTEHAGYHEALIGAGQVLGPGIGALTQWRWPTRPLAGVAAVTGVLLLSLVAAMVAAGRARKRDA
ncbi:MAG: MFS transporter [Phycisphaerae bacterium]